ncbi:uncharacterized protein TA08330 [Theileria annulata]|uniref:Uncharacterized protein n=1 Tax=Theileria annulata TaxID=5874 RepID=Q4U9P6_THEAN|nr:uncharacterized protein TA08330 [Theileria annulata]CAI76457.1 hypothetical protein TA08330 [Theileria annulata]|eukprot:XP_953082.1 hypothetical protein TA08330 [Theileria annulata]
MDYGSESHSIEDPEERGSRQMSETLGSEKSSEMSSERSSVRSSHKSSDKSSEKSEKLSDKSSEKLSEKSEKSSEKVEKSESSASLSHSVTSRSSESKEDVSIEIDLEKNVKPEVPVKEGFMGLPKEDRMLRIFLIIGFFPLPVLGWIIGFLYSLTIKKRTKSQKKFTLILGALSGIALIVAISLTAYFLLSKTEKKTEPTPSVDKVKPEPGAKRDEKEKKCEGSCPEEVKQLPDPATDLKDKTLPEPGSVEKQKRECEPNCEEEDKKLQGPEKVEKQVRDCDPHCEEEEKSKPVADPVPKPALEPAKGDKGKKCENVEKEPHKGPRRTEEGSDYENGCEEQGSDQLPPGPAVKVPEEHVKVQHVPVLSKEDKLKLEIETLRDNVDSLGRDQKLRREELFKTITDPVKAKEIPSVPGLFIPTVITKYDEPKFKLKKPENVFIPPTLLKTPVPVTKSFGLIKFDYFQYVHPKSENNMLILLRGLHSSWKKNELFRFSEYVNHNVMVVNVTDDHKKDIVELLGDLENFVKTKTKKNMTLVTEVKHDEIEKFLQLQKEVSLSNIYTIFRRNSKEFSPSVVISDKNVFDYPEFIGIFDEKIECNKKSVDFPVMVVKNELVEYELMEKGISDMKLNFNKLSRCDDVLNTEEQTKIFLNKLYGPFRKFATATKTSLEEDELLKAVMCSRH